MTLFRPEGSGGSTHSYVLPAAFKQSRLWESGAPTVALAKLFGCLWYGTERLKPVTGMSPRRGIPENFWVKGALLSQQASLYF